MDHLFILPRNILLVTVVQAEGLDATFLLILVVILFMLLINGTSLHNVNVSNGLIRREGCGQATKTLSYILPYFNLMEQALCVLCTSSPMGRWHSLTLLQQYSLYNVFYHAYHCIVS